MLGRAATHEHAGKENFEVVHDRRNRRVDFQFKGNGFRFGRDRSGAGVADPADAGSVSGSDEAAGPGVGRGWLAVTSFLSTLWRWGKALTAMPIVPASAPANVIQRP